MRRLCDRIHSVEFFPQPPRNLDRRLAGEPISELRSLCSTFSLNGGDDPRAGLHSSRPLRLGRYEVPRHGDCRVTRLAWQLRDAQRCDDSALKIACNLKIGIEPIRTCPGFPLGRIKPLATLRPNRRGRLKVRLERGTQPFKNMNGAAMQCRSVGHGCHPSPFERLPLSTSPPCARHAPIPPTDRRIDSRQAPIRSASFNAGTTMNDSLSILTRTCRHAPTASFWSYCTKEPVKSSKKPSSRIMDSR